MPPNSHVFGIPINDNNDSHAHVVAYNAKHTMKTHAGCVFIVFLLIKYRNIILTSCLTFAFTFSLITFRVGFFLL